MESVSSPLRCFGECHTAEKYTDDGVETVTSVEQRKVERSIQEVISVYKQIHSLPQPTLLRDQHYQYLKKGLRHLSDAYECLDASRPWLCYWILHSLELLEEPVPTAIASDVCKFLARCQSPTGGFAGGPCQAAHLAPTYAAVNALCIIGTQEAYNIIDREKLLSFLFSVKQPDGSFVMHIGGEVDVRSTYCAASVASLTNIMTPTLFQDTPTWIVSCQNWEGGLGGVPGLEAHGGYTFCGTAAMVILGKEHMLDLKSLLRWVASRQMRYEGGFQGRCNKLVDGCYSFWQAGLLPLLHRALFKGGDSTLSLQKWMFEQQALQEYILLCCQNPAGGLLDKPGKSRDFYHTCYCLSGLSVAQHFGNMDLHHELIVGREENRLAPSHPVYNICPEKVAQAIQHFHQLLVPVPAQKEGSSACNTTADHS
ncbi:protein farnesyltransferase subunit beta isoform X6 [Oncorhynchus keta]|uniref:protein farnesyltransferase subunit beta isoform X6 n=1 Tax=Oncorhynchus keta TaxID=8018 RepID=UPI00227ADB85|nr:protein farnesyltransferase subunit beta isoform X6 [Oncorhynchus keta]